MVASHRTGVSAARPTDAEEEADRDGDVIEPAE
jgi:hypothetical protein